MFIDSDQDDDVLFARRMLASEYYFADDWMRSPRVSTSLALTLFMAIRKIIIAERIRSPTVSIFFADGQQLQRYVSPDWKSYPVYWLQKPEVSEALKLLINTQLLKMTYKNSGPQGYGGDRIYTITSKALAIMTLATRKGDIYRGIKNVLHEHLDYR